MTAAVHLDTADIALLRSGLHALRGHHETSANLFAQHAQGATQTHGLRLIGDHLQTLRLLDLRLRDAGARIAGTGLIQHGNTDIHDPGALTRAEQAREANTRG